MCVCVCLFACLVGSGGLSATYLDVPTCMLTSDLLVGGVAEGAVLLPGIPHHVA